MQIDIDPTWRLQRCAAEELRDVVKPYLTRSQTPRIDALIQEIRERAEAIPNPRRAASVDHSQADCFMEGFAMLSLKEPSLLAFNERRNDASLKNLYQIKSILSDTQHRQILGKVDPQLLNQCFEFIHNELQRGGELKPASTFQPRELAAYQMWPGRSYCLRSNIAGKNKHNRR